MKSKHIPVGSCSLSTMSPSCANLGLLWLHNKLYFYLHCDMKMRIKTTAKGCLNQMTKKWYACDALPLACWAVHHMCSTSMCE